MFRVPTDPNRPTFDHTFKVGFFKWLTSGKTERVEWARRRNAAAQIAAHNQRVAGERHAANLAARIEQSGQKVDAFLDKAQNVAGAVGKIDDRGRRRRRHR